jgi:hypothetical protein
MRGLLKFVSLFVLLVVVAAAALRTHDINRRSTALVDDSEAKGNFIKTNRKFFFFCFC